MNLVNPSSFTDKNSIKWCDKLNDILLYKFQTKTPRGYKEVKVQKLDTCTYKSTLKNLRMYKMLSVYDILLEKLHYENSWIDKNLMKYICERNYEEIISAR